MPFRHPRKGGVRFDRDGIVDKPIKEIVAEAEYLDVASFVRKFRQMEGITPGEYRRQAQARIVR